MAAEATAVDSDAEQEELRQVLGDKLQPAWSLCNVDRLDGQMHSACSRVTLLVSLRTCLDLSVERRFVRGKSEAVTGMSTNRQHPDIPDAHPVW